MLYRFEILTLKARKSLNFPTPPVCVPARAAKNFVMKFGIRKLESSGTTRWWRNHDAIAVFVLTQYQLVTDRQTDRHVAIAKTRASICAHGRPHMFNLQQTYIVLLHYFRNIGRTRHIFNCLYSTPRPIWYNAVNDVTRAMQCPSKFLKTALVYK